MSPLILRWYHLLRQVLNLTVHFAQGIWIANIATFHIDELLSNVAMLPSVNGSWRDIYQSIIARKWVRIGHKTEMTMCVHLIFGKEHLQVNI